jgi:hypothetical protein
MLTYLFCQLMRRQVWSWWWWQQEIAPNFLSATWHGEAFHNQDVESLILVDALFPFDGGRRREGKKINHYGGGGFPWGWTHLAGCAMGCSC